MAMAAQIEGGLVYGISAALYGKVTVQDGQIEQTNFHDYPVLRMNEMPEIEVIVVDSLWPSLRQSRLAQAVREDGEVLRPADREPIPELGGAERGIDLAQMSHRALRFTGPSGKRVAGRDDCDRHHKARQILE